MNDLDPPITGQAAKMTTTKVDDNTTLVCTVHLNAKPVFAECCAAARDGTQRRIGKSPAGYRIDSASAEAFDDGTVRFWLSCWPESQSGTEAAVRYLDFPDAVAPGASSSFVDAPGELQQVFAKADWEGEAVIHLSNLNPPIPPSEWLSVQIIVSGIEERGASVEGLAAYVQSDGRATDSGVIQAGPDNTLTVRSIGGVLGELHVNVLGWCQ